MISVNRKAFILIVCKLVSPGLFVITYLQKLIDTKNCNTKIQYIKGACLSNPLKIIVISATTKDKKIIPIKEIINLVKND